MNESNAQAAIDAGKIIGAQKTFPIDQRTNGLLVPEGFELQTHDSTPSVTIASSTVRTLDGFEIYYEKFSAEQTLVQLENEDSDGLGDDFISAKFDYHTRDETGWDNHSLNLRLSTTQEFDDWSRANGQPMPHVEFVEFLENHERDITAPGGAELAELIADFKVKRNVTFENKVSNMDGKVQLVYKEDDENGTTTLPEQVKIEIPVLEAIRETKIELLADIFYRMNGGALTLGYKIRYIEDAERLAKEELTKQVEERLDCEVII